MWQLKDKTEGPRGMYQAWLFHKGGREDTNHDNQNRLTKAGLRDFLRTEKERLFGKGKNIRYMWETSRGYLMITRKQFDSLIEQHSHEGRYYLAPCYDDMDDGISISVLYCPDKKQKTVITIYT